MTRGDLQLLATILLCSTAVLAVSILDWRATALFVCGQMSTLLLTFIVFGSDD